MEGVPYLLVESGPTRATLRRVSYGRETGVPPANTARTEFASFFRQNQEQLVKRWTELAASSLRRRLTEAELSREIQEMADALLAVFDSSSWDVTRPEADELRGLLAELSRSRARRGFSTQETAVSVFTLKQAVQQVFDIRQSATSLQGYVEFGEMVDQMAMLTFESYAQTREELIGQQSEQLLELSTPVVKLWEGVLAVPLVGTLDSARAQVVMERLLEMLVETGSAYAIIDITGVPAVDTQVAQHILKTVVAARLMGAECVISGIRPQIAQTIVALGIEFGDILTKASLADALVHALRSNGVEMVQRASSRVVR